MKEYCLCYYREFAGGNIHTCYVTVSADDLEHAKELLNMNCGQNLKPMAVIEICFPVPRVYSVVGL